MFSFLKKLFGSGETAGKVIEKAADGIYNGIDKLVYTDEERADALAKGRELFMEFAKVAYDENSIRSVTRRWLAFMVVAPTMLAFVVSGVMYLFNQPYADHLFQMVQTMGPWAAGVLAFYFGPHILGALK